MRSSVLSRGLRISAVALLVVTLLSAFAVRAGADDPTVSHDAMRTGFDPDEPGLSPASVSSSDFGSLFNTTLPLPSGKTTNQVYAQPIVAGGTLIVATEENQVDGLDPASGAVRWTVQLGPAWPAATTGCGDLTPDIGITSTPVYDSSTNTVYVSAKVNDGPDPQHPNFKLAALDATTGAMRPNWPVTISGAPSNDPFRVFNAEQAGQRAGLLLMGGRIFIGFASHCSFLPYVGYVAGVSTSTRAVSLWTTEAGNTSSGGGVWQSGGGLVSDGPGRIFIATGNGFSGASPAPGPGTSPPATLAESVVRLSVGADGTLTAKDFFSPVNNPELDRNDTDLGSGGPTALPDSFGTTTHPHLIIQVGKDGRVFLLDRDSLGGTGQGAGGKDAYLSQVQLKGVWGHFAVWPGDGGYVYIVENSGNLRALRITPNGSGVPTLSVAGASPEVFGYTSGSPVVTASGTTSGTALVWVVQSSGPTGTGGRLLAYDAVPAGGVMHLRYAASIGTVAKFIVPATDAGRVYVATRDGTVLGFGRPVTSILTASPVDFASVAVGTTATATLTLRASAPVTITSVATDLPFSAGAPSKSLPATLSSGQSLSVPLTFKPTSPVSFNGLVRVATSAAGTTLVDVHGLGTAPGLAANPPSVDFGPVAVGAAKQTGVTVRNTGTTSVAVTAIHLPGAPFKVSGLPAVGHSIAAGASVTFSVTASPTASGVDSDFTRVSWAGHHLTVPLSVTGTVGTAHLTLAPAILDFGPVPPGGNATLTFDVANTGTAALTLTKAAPPAAPFRVDDPIPEGATLQPGDVVHMSVTVYPTSAQPVTDAYSITANDGSGEQAVTVRVNSTPPVGPITVGTRCLAPADPAIPAGTAAVAAACTGGPGQLAYLPGDGTLSLDGVCLNASGITAGSAVVLQACANVGYQKWQWQSDQTLMNRKSGLCLSLPGSAVADGALVLHSCSAAPTRQFDLGAITAARGFVTGVHGLCLDAPTVQSEAGAPVQTWTCDSTAAEEVVIPPGTGTLQLLGACAQLTGASPARGALITLATCNGQPRQQWAPQPDGALVNPATALCLDVPGASATPGVQLQAWTCNGTPAQTWTLPL